MEVMRTVVSLKLSICSYLQLTCCLVTSKIDLTSSSSDLVLFSSSLVSLNSVLVLSCSFCCSLVSCGTVS